jgi:hypothetical protein
MAQLIDASVIIRMDMISSSLPLWSPIDKPPFPSSLQAGGEWSVRQRGGRGRAVNTPWGSRQSIAVYAVLRAWTSVILATQHTR